MLVELIVANHAIPKKHFYECTHDLSTGYIWSLVRLVCMGITETLAMPLHQTV